MSGIATVERLVERNGLPAALETERTILGSMQDNPVALCEGLDLLTEGCFALDSHRKIFAAYRRMHEAGTSVNLRTVSDELRRTHELEAVGGGAYLMHLLENVFRHEVLADYAKVLKRKAAQRETLLMIERVATRTVDGTTDPEELLAELTTRAQEIESGSTRSTYRPLADSVGAVMQEMIHQRDRETGLLGITTGLATLDELTTGYRDGELTYVGATPGRGKTSFMLQGVFAAARAGIPVGIVSLEMRTNQLIKRLAILASKLEAWKFRDAKKMNASDFRYALNEVEHLGNLPVFACDQDGLRPHEIASMARRMVKQDGVRILFVDFVQIVNEPSRTQKESVDRISASLRSIAKALNIPVVAASQLARRDGDVNRVPTLHDLRESGNLEQDAHNVMFLYRPVERATSAFTGEDQIIVAKAREGTPGSLPARYDTNSLIYVPREAGR